MAPGADHQVLLDRQGREDPAALGHEGDTPAGHGVGGQVVDGVAVEADLARPRRGEADDAADEGGLADSIPSEQRHRLARSHLERHVVEHVAVAVVGVDALDLQHHPSSSAVPR